MAGFGSFLRGIGRLLGFVKKESPKPPEPPEDLLPPKDFLPPPGGVDNKPPPPGGEEIEDFFNDDIEVKYVERVGKENYWVVDAKSPAHIERLFRESSKGRLRQFYTIVVEGEAEPYEDAGPYTSPIRDDGTRILSYAKRDIDVWSGIMSSYDPTEQINNMLFRTEVHWKRVDRVYVIDRRNQF